MIKIMKRKNLRRTTPLIFLVFLLAALVPAISRPVRAQTKTYYWQQFDVDVQVLENGDLMVTERQTLNFSGAPFTFGYRTVPTDSSGRNDGIEEVSVRQGDQVYQQSGSQSPGTFRLTRSGDETEIYWYFAPATGSNSYTVSYRVLNAVRTEPGGDQVFWNALPADLGAPVQNSTMTISLPEGIEAASTIALYDGRESDRVQSAVSSDGRTVTFRLTQPRLSGDRVEIGVRFPSGQLDVSTPAWQQAEQRADVISLALLVVSLLLVVGGPLGALLLWYLFGRDPQVGPIPDYLAEPPDETPPAVVGTLVDETAHIHDVMSTLVDLAERGYLTMTETGSGKDYNFTRTKKPLDDLKRFERKMIEGIFRGKRSRDLDSLRYKFSSRLPAIRKELYRELEERGYVRSSPEGVRNRYGCLAFLVLGLAFLAFVAGSAVFGGNVSTLICPALALGLTAIALFIVSRFMPAKTSRGAEAAARWLAFKKYLKDIEEYTNLEEATEIFQKYLGYAVAFGLERSWIRKFASVPGAPIPPWYVPYPVYRGHSRRSGGSVRGGTPRSGQPEGGSPLESLSGGLSGGLAGMSSGLTRMLTSTQTVLQSSRSSSSGSGGGFSGGFSGGSSGGGSGGFG